MEQTLMRLVNNRVRVYSLRIIRNLFGDWMVIRTYSSLVNRDKGRSLWSEYDTYEEAIAACERLINQKKNRGYVCADV